MSATNRGSKRVKSDYYPTPDVTIDTFLNNYQIKKGAILECAAGDGAFVRGLRRHGYNNEIISNEIHDHHNLSLHNSGSDQVYNYDFINDNLINLKNQDIRTIISNPPFSVAREFLEKCFTEFPNAEVIMLLRTAILESKGRHQFWQQYPPNKLYVLSQRPKFINNKTDATCYSYIVFDDTDQQEIKVI